MIALNWKASLKTAGMAGLLLGSAGIVLAIVPDLWTDHFTHDPAVLATSPKGTILPLGGLDQHRRQPASQRPPLQADLPPDTFQDSEEPPALAGMSPEHQRIHKGTQRTQSVSTSDFVSSVSFIFPL